MMMIMNGLAQLTPLQQLRAGRLPRRVTQLMIGLVLYGLSMAMMIRGALGLDPWDVFHSGLTSRLPLTFGTVVIITGAVVLLAWIPLRQQPGLGTVANVVVVGLASDLGLALLPAPGALALRIALLVGGIAVNGLATALYIGAQLGPGPRDGLMTGIARRFGWSIRVVRTLIELTALGIGFLLGGAVGIGTIAYALAIGPLAQLLLPRFIVALPEPRRTITPVNDGRRPESAQNPH